MALQNTNIQTMNAFLGGVYAIPNYQREYSWEEAELEDFFEDLRATVEDADRAPHFFGQIVIHNDENAHKKYIIDGQQRTITSTIFMRTLQIFYEAIYKETDSRRADYKKSDISAIHIGRYEGPTNDDLHLHLGELDNDYFRTAIQIGHPENSAKQKRRPHERLRRAYLFFYTQIKGMLESLSGTEDRLDLLDEYYNAFTKRFLVLYMEATQLDEAFVIFETLNARGKELETADLLKNFIFMQSKDIATAQAKWNTMISTLDRADPTKYIRHLWNAKWNFTREKILYKEISKKIKSPRASGEFLQQLAASAGCYHDMSIANQNENICLTDPNLLRSLRALKTLKATTFYPVILAMHQRASFTEADMAAVAGTIETYVFRNFTVCGKVANKSEIFFADIARDIDGDILDTVPAICERIRSEMVGNTEFEDMFMLWTGSKSTKETVRYILRKIHKHLDGLNEINVDNTEVHIEHIMTENNDAWQVPADIHEAYLWRLGNLALLSGPLNISLSNKPFADKKDRYLVSKIEPNRNIAANAVWTHAEIEARQRILSQHAKQIWQK